MAGSRRGAAAAVPAFYRLLITLLTLFAFPRSADGGVHAVLPSSGAAGGSDTAVTVLGADFFQTPKTSCRFGGDVVAADVTDESTVVCYPPASVDGAGFVYVEVSMNALDFTSSGVLYSYVEPAQLASMHPLGADAAGGSLVHVISRAAPRLGGGFTPESRCVFLDGADVVDADTRFVSSAVATCVTPKLRVGSVTATVGIGPGGATWMSSSSARAFATWRTPETLEALDGAGTVSVLEGVEGGGLTTRLTSADLLASWAEGAKASCRFGTIAVDAIVGVVDAGGESAEDGGVRVTAAVCVSPAGVRGREVNVRLVTTIGDCAQTASPTLTFGSGPELSVEGETDTVATGEVLGVLPRRVSTLGSPRSVAMLGKNFAPGASQCLVGESSWASEFVSSALMLCELPPHAAGAVVVATEESPAELTATALYVPEVVVEGLSTASGGTAGGTVVKISAEWLPDGDVLAARVGTTGPVAARWMSRLSAEAVTPARTAGAAEMWLDVFGDSRSSTSAWFSYAEPGAVVAAMPSLAPVSGTEWTSLVGWSLPARDVVCVVGGTRAEGCALPAGGMGYTELSVDGHSGTAVVSYAARPQVLGVSPKTGYARGGAIASVVGAGFMDEKAACVYGGVHAPAEFISSSLLRCESPSLSLGAVTVEVAAGSGTIVSESEMTVSVIADMRVQYVTPSSGPTQGGNVITVYGKYFVGIEPVACKLGSIGPLDARDNDATGLNLTAGLECVAPARPAGAARVAVGIRTSGYTDDDVQYLYASALAVQAVMPSAGETTSLRTISVFGMTLRSGVGSCVFGPRASAGVVRRHGEMVCDVQGGFGEGFFAVGAGGLRVEDGELNVVFEFRKPAEALLLHPRSGYGGSPVHVYGAHLEGAGCAFGGMLGMTHVVSTAVMKCEAPAIFSVGDVGVRLTDGLLAGSAAELMYEFRVEEAVQTLVPGNSSTAGGELVEVLATQATSMGNSRALACAVGSIAPVSARFMKERVAECSMPARAEGVTEIRVGIGNEFGRYGKPLTFAREPEIMDDMSLPVSMDVLSVISMEEPEFDVWTVRSVEPLELPALAGGVITISGDFDTAQAVECRVGTIDIAGRLVDGSTVECMAPYHIAETVEVGVSGAMGLSLDYIKPNITEISWNEVEADLEFTASEAGEEPEFDGSVVREVRPMELVANEGGVITVTGDFTDVETVACRVGTFGPIAGRRVDARTVECFAPYHVSGVVEISVNGAMGVALQYVAPAYVEDVVFDDSAPVEEVYEPVFDATSLRGVEPANVTTTEGGVITITGSFREVEKVACRVGTIGPMFGRLLDSETVECFAPFHAPGAVDVSINGALGASLTYLEPTENDFGFDLDDVAEINEGTVVNLTFASDVEEPTFDGSEVRSITPTSVTTEGGSVVIDGSFPMFGKVACRFGAVDVAGRLTDDLTVECFAPFHAAGIAEVAVNGATGIQLRYNSTAFENAELSVEGETDTVATGEVLGVLPRRVSTLGSPRSVAMLGKNFAPGASRCLVGESSWASEFVSSALMLCELPPHAAGAVVVATEESPAELTATALYVPEVVVEGLSTASGGTAGGTVVKISAEWLPDGDVLAARVGTTGPVAARWMSRLSAEAVTPARTAGAAEMWLDVFGDSRSSTSAWFSYAEPGAVVAAMPSLAPVSGTEWTSLVGWSLPARDVVCVVGGTRAEGCARCRREVWDTPSCLWMAILERRW